MRILEVTWRMANYTAQLAPAGREIAQRRARVWLEGLRPCGAWLDDSGRWRRFHSCGIPARLWELAQLEGREVRAKERKAA